ncbi:hypothetical protein ABK040_002900 [Willaertia magna]
MTSLLTKSAPEGNQLFNLNNNEDNIQPKEISNNLKNFMIELEECFKRNEKSNVNPDEIKQIFLKHSKNLTLKDYKQFCLIDKNISYTRNLISNNPYFSLIVLVWNPGQHSTIHAHGGSQCWFNVMKGCIKECRWLVNPKIDTSLNNKPTKEFIAKEGGIGYIDDSNGVHAIVNELNNDISISVHCYAPPYHETEIYSEDDGHVDKGFVVYDSIAGIPINNKKLI